MTETPAARELASVLAEHFVMWHALGGRGVPPGEWRCQCGKKFGFSDSAIDHQADALLPFLAEREAAARSEALREAADDVEAECTASSESCFCGSAAWMRERAAQIESGDGCDCTELCSMGPTCPGGMLARLPGSGCWRTASPNLGAALAEFVESDAVQYALTVAEAGQRSEAEIRLQDAAKQAGGRMDDASRAAYERGRKEVVARVEVALRSSWADVRTHADAARMIRAALTTGAPDA